MIAKTIMRRILKMKKKFNLMYPTQAENDDLFKKPYSKVKNVKRIMHQENLFFYNMSNIGMNLDQNVEILQSQEKCMKESWDTAVILRV